MYFAVLKDIARMFNAVLARKLFAEKGGRRGMG